MNENYGTRLLGFTVLLNWNRCRWCRIAVCPRGSTFTIPLNMILPVSWSKQVSVKVGTDWVYKYRKM